MKSVSLDTRTESVTFPQQTEGGSIGRMESNPVLDTDNPGRMKSTILCPLNSVETTPMKTFGPSNSPTTPRKTSGRTTGMIRRVFIMRLSKTRNSG